jgi:hypothetical protein
MLKAAIAAAALALFLAACGQAVIEADEAESSVAEVVSSEAGFEPEDVECPDDVDAEVGGTFTCTFTGPDGPYDAEVEMTEVDGEQVQFQIEAKPSGK